MKKTFISVVLFLFFELPALSQAMTLERVNNDLYATGPTVDQDFLSFQDAFAQRGIERLILVNAPGGDLWTGMRIAHMVQEAKIKTVASGPCMSACSLIFMAGQERSFGTGHLPRVTMIGIHGAHDKNSKNILYQVMPQMYALYKQQMREKFDAAVINQALYDIKEASGFLRIREIQRTQEKDRTPWFCPTGQTPFDQCQQHSGKDAYTLGIVTQTETVDLQLPASMKIKLGFFGTPLDAPTVDFQDLANQTIETLCKGQLLCKTIGGRTFQNYLSAHQNKAIAIGWSKTGFGVRWGVDDPGQAMMRALYNCNHAKNNPKLCRLVAVNDHELLPLYDEEQTQSAVLLDTLNAPTPALSQAERDEPGTNNPTRLRTGNNVTGMTPKALEGIQRWDTATLVQALKQNERPVVIDAAAFGPVIPSALNLIHIGLAFEDVQQESAYAERFRHMLLAAVPNLNQAVVFYCANSECWLSVNAAMRARQLGYTQVIWYRGGINAWMQAGLPTVRRVPVAVLN
jgi:PQQ-dependent catabolism-associated CXXCW motif protein